MSDKCMVCGRRLKSPAAQEMGVGPKCAKKAGLTIGRWRKYIEDHQGRPMRYCFACKLFYAEKDCPGCTEQDPFAAEMPPVKEDLQ